MTATDATASTLFTLKDCASQAKAYPVEGDLKNEVLPLVSTSGPLVEVTTTYDIPNGAVRGDEEKDGPREKHGTFSTSDGSIPFVCMTPRVEEYPRARTSA